ncbi:MAG TPA: hypothetical protein VMU62_04840, partial [Acidobacteriaceae bacterium]|nr:hypothetical protein [Acidobacteriaceae bacterium]
MVNSVRVRLNINLATINIFIAPISGITALQGGNPAIYVRQNQMMHAVNNWTREMTEYATAHPHEVIPVNLIQRGTCIIVAETVFTTWTLMNRCGVLWHELGHAYNEIVARPNTEQNAYLFEVEMLDWAATTNVFSVNGISATDVLNYLNWRQTQYNNGITPALTLALAALRTKLPILGRHGFLQP